MKKSFHDCTWEERNNLSEYEALCAEQASMSLEKVRPHCFHIHLDAHAVIPEKLLQYIVDAGGFKADFLHSEEVARTHFEPKYHTTLVTADSKQYSQHWKSMKRLAYETGFVGYIEGEYIPIDMNIPARPFVQIQTPFFLTRRKLSEAEPFRKSELHVAYDDAKTDPRVTDLLYSMGLYGALMPKTDRGNYRIMTVQGSVQEINSLAPQLYSFLSALGGMWCGTIKIEVIRDYEIYDVSFVDMPEVIDQICWHTCRP